MMNTTVLASDYGNITLVGSSEYCETSPSLSSTSTVSTQESVFSLGSQTSSQSFNSDFQSDTNSDCDQELCQQCLSVPAEPVTSAQCMPPPHPRRSSTDSRQPPSLPCQAERKVVFVNDLVDSATSMVEVIWPLSNSAGQVQGSAGRGVLPLRRYIEETLRRSRTSYSTLQVALYYLILIKSHVPACDFTMPQPADCASLRALQCGRRMFLAALILASKYLQDRNYSAKAWSKMSGLKSCEINGNERCFLSAVNWRLHISDTIFRRWTDVILRFTASKPPPPPPGQSTPVLDNKARWASVIPLLNPELDNIDICHVFGIRREPPCPPLPPAKFVAPTVMPPKAEFYPPLTPYATNTTPLNPQPYSPPTPALLNQGPLPTPHMTPSSVASSTPAASAWVPKRLSICSAMSQIRNDALCRSTTDRFPTACPVSRSSSSTAHSIVSLASSSEPVISGLSRSSRSSSVSSVSNASTSAPQAILAKLATCRCSGMQGSLRGNDQAELTPDSAQRPITVLYDANLVASPDVTMQEDDDSTPKKDTISVPPKTCGRKRCRSRPTSTVDLQANVRSFLEQNSRISSTVTLDENETESSVSPCTLRRAMQSLCRSSPVASSRPPAKALQPPSSLSGAGGTSRLPVCHDSGKKRACCITPLQRSPQNGGTLPSP